MSHAAASAAMRPSVCLALALLALLVAGCSATPSETLAGNDANAPKDPVADVEVGSGRFFIGLPSGPVTDISGGVGFTVPVNATHLTVVVDVVDGASVGLVASGTSGCEHAYPDPQVPLDPYVYECDAAAGDHILEFRHAGGRVTIDVMVYAGHRA